MDNDKLIEEAAKAFIDTYHDREGSWDELPLDDDMGLTPRGNTIRGLLAARAVFEKALGEATVTPTDDERKRVLAILSDMDYNDGGMMRWSSGRPTEQAEKVADRIIRELAGFRRPEVPEPSAECAHEAHEIDTAGNSIRCADCGATEGLAPLAALPLDNLEQCASCGSFACDCYAALEPQGEPSGAHDIIVQEVSRLAGMQLLRRHSSFSDTWWDELHAGIARVALTASAVTDQGENQ